MDTSREEAARLLSVMRAAAERLSGAQQQHLEISAHAPFELVLAVGAEAGVSVHQYGGAERNGIPTRQASVRVGHAGVTLIVMGTRPLTAADLSAVAS